MTMGHHPHTATILPFPGRTRSSGASGRPGVDLSGKPGDEGKTQRVAHPCFMDSWYHQAAINEAPQARKP